MRYITTNPGDSELHRKARCVHPPGMLRCNWCGMTRAIDPALVNLTIAKDRDEFIVSEPSAPGSPEVGYGRTMNEALGAWFTRHAGDFGVTITPEGSVIDTLRRQAERLLSKR